MRKIAFLIINILFIIFFMFFLSYKVMVFAQDKTAKLKLSSTNTSAPGGGGGGGGGGNNSLNNNNNKDNSSNNNNNNDFTVPASSTTGKTDDLCENLILSADSIGPGETINLTAIAKNNDIKKFTFEFYNIDNRLNNKPKAIGFSGTGNNPFKKVLEFGLTQKIATASVSFDEIDKRDINWSYYMPKPKNIWVELYMTNSANKVSKYSASCSKRFFSKAIDPTPTINPNCKCSNSKCASVCFFDKFSGVTYSSPRKCAAISGIYQSSPVADDQTRWCRYYLLARGDANGDGKVNLLDYFYYQQAQYGGKIPPSVNLDFNGNGLVNPDDKTILFKSIKP